MSAQPYSELDLRAIRAAHAGGIPATVDLAWVKTAEPRWLATVDALTSRLDAATREMDELRAYKSRVAGLHSELERERDEARLMLDRLSADRIESMTKLAAERDAATRRADEVGSLLREAQPHLIARTLSPTPHPWEVRDERAKAELLAKIDAALSTGSTPATAKANPGDKADCIDAAKEGRHA